MPFKDKISLGDTITFGGYYLSDSQKNKLNNKLPVTYTKDILDRATSASKAKLQSLNYNLLK